MTVSVLTVYPHDRRADPKLRLAATAQCHRRACRQPRKRLNFKIEVRFLLTAYHFHAILKSKNSSPVRPTADSQPLPSPRPLHTGFHWHLLLDCSVRGPPSSLYLLPNPQAAASLESPEMIPAYEALPLLRYCLRENLICWIFIEKISRSKEQALMRKLSPWKPVRVPEEPRGAEENFLLPSNCSLGSAAMLLAGCFGYEWQSTGGEDRIGWTWALWICQRKKITCNLEM
ncbi:uncharacterized protein LOC132512798 [Lagenorhynchus albirostris]|uniref:uncharacterized protein LOC132512798 n=1 Tax=Lagenorhynchus albirostris TaxID=27610 RepID=UPI0028E62707|nr:uncharacterized protein LOC132512798 [Lagenorhynchus albirostris]